MTDQLIPTAEQDVRIEVLNSLLKTPHRDLASLGPIHAAALERDPLFYGHFSVWAYDTTSVRDVKVLVCAHLITSPYALHREAGWVLIQSLPIHQIGQLVEYCKGTLHKEPKILRSAVENVLRTLEAQGRKFERIAVRNRENLHYLYQKLHIRPGSDRVQQLIFKRAAEAGSIGDVVRRIAQSTDDGERARLIVEHKIPYDRAVGAVTSRGGRLTPATKLAILMVMTPNEVRNHQAALKRWGLMDQPEAAEIIKQKIAAGTKDKRVQAGRADQAMAAAEAAGASEDIVAAIRESRDLAIKGGTRIPSASLHIDKSSSMSRAIDRGKALAARLAAHCDDLSVYAFDSVAYKRNIPAGASLTVIEREFAQVLAGGNTAIGAGMAKMQRDGDRKDLILVVTDMQDGGGNARPLFEDGYNGYAAAMNHRPNVIVLGVGDVDRSRENRWKAAGVPVQFIDWTDPKSDAYAIDNLIERIAAPDYVAMIEAIMEIELPTRPKPQPALA